MKRISTLIISFLFVGVNSIKAQTCTGGPSNCAITTGSVASVVTKVQQVGSNCETTINVSFDLGHNNGLKWVPLYFYNNAIPTGVCGTTPSSQTQLLAFVLLERGSGSNFTKSDLQVGTISPSTNYSLQTSAITNGSRINVIGLTITRAGACTPSPIAVYVGADNANKPGISCYSSGSFTPYQLLVSGKVNCNGPRNYDLIIDSDFRGTGNLESVGGGVQVFIDDNNNGIVEVGEQKITDNTFATIIDLSSPKPNRYTSFNNIYCTACPLGGLYDKLIVQLTPSNPLIAPLTARLAGSCAPLPVVLKNFNAKLNNNAVALTWETADEINNKGFEIQRRFNGEATYQKIAFVEAKATQGLGASYSFTDANARNKGSVSYRLAQEDVDGKISLSEIRIVNTGAGNSQIAVYPNPSKGTVRVSLPTQVSKADISLEDFSGKTIQRWNAYSANTLQIDQIRPGIYLIRVRLQETGEQMIERLIVQ